MSHQQYPQPQQPGWNGPQQPGQPQPGWGGPQQGWGAPPPPAPKKRGVGKMLGFGCLGFVAVLVLIAVVAALGGGGGKSDESSKVTGSQPSAAASKGEKAGAGSKASGTTDGKAAKAVTFKVWGTAPAGDLGSLDITYGSDSDTRKGKFANGKFEATLPLNGKAMFYNVTAQLQGSGDINCSVTVDGHTKQGHAAGGYNICDAQLSSLLGDWG